MDLLFRWANDTTTRAHAFQPQEIKYDTHQKWFADKLNAKNSVIYIYCQDDVPIAQARIDMDGHFGLISCSVECAYRMQGLGGTLLELLESAVASELPQVKTLVAQVKYANIASQRKFEQGMYEQCEKEDYIEYKKTIEANPTVLR